MAAILSMAREMLRLGRERIQQRDFQTALRYLQRLLDLPDTPPALAAEAEFLIGQVYFFDADYRQARQCLQRVLERDPHHADSQYLLAQTIDDPRVKLQRLAEAARLAPHDPRRRCAYGRKLAELGDRGEGLRLLEDTYAECDSDPVVVESYAEGLWEAGRHEEAELLVDRASRRNPEERELRQLRERFRLRRVESRLYDEPRDDAPRDVLTFPSFAQKRDAAPELPSRFSAEATLEEVLATLPLQQVEVLAESLGVDEADLETVADALLERETLRRRVGAVPARSRQLLQTIVRAGGCVPASVLHQNTGPDAAPSDHARPLIEAGLLYLGHEARRPSKLTALVPFDLAEELEQIWTKGVDTPVAS